MVCLREIESRTQSVPGVGQKRPLKSFFLKTNKQTMKGKRKRPISRVYEQTGRSQSQPPRGRSRRPAHIHGISDLPPEEQKGEEGTIFTHTIRGEVRHGDKPPEALGPDYQRATNLDQLPQLEEETRRRRERQKGRVLW